MKACCLEGSVHQGEPVGRIEKLFGLDCYITEPVDSSNPKALIVYLPDAFGWSLPNNRLLADTYARRTGARVYLPEFMDGNGFPPETMGLLLQLMEPSESWFSMLYKTIPSLRALTYVVPRIRGLSDGPCRPRIISFLTSLRREVANPNNLRVGAAGFCWGGHHIADLCAGLKTPEGQDLIDAGFTAHPSKLNVPTDIEKVKLPLSVIIGDIDFGLSVEKCREAQKVLQAKGDEKRYEFRILEGAKHGFAIRHDMENEEEARLAQVAEDQAVEFWSRWIGTSGIERK